MGRGRVELKRIENKINRQVTFSKRKSGLLKKAREITLMCDADVALIVFSSKGKRIDYATDSSMERIIARHEKYSSSDEQLLPTDIDSNGRWTHERAKLQSRIEILQRNQRNLIGEDLDSLNLREVQNLESQLENALKHIRLKKNQFMNQYIAELHKKEKEMQGQNNMLGKKIVVEREKALDEHARPDRPSHDAGPPPIRTSQFILQSVDIMIREIHHVEASTGQNEPSTVVLPWMLSLPSK